MSFGMRMEPAQHQEQVQTQEISQRMIQAMELLQLPIQKFEERIEEEYISNPLLEREENEDSSEKELGEEGPEKNTPEDSNDFEDSSVDYLSDESGNAAKNEKEDLEYQEAVIDNSDTEFADPDDRIINYKDSDSVHRNREEDTEHYLDYMNNIPSRGQTLQEHLIEQLYWFDIPEKIRTYAEEIIHNLDRRGYLTLSKEEREEYKTRGSDRKGGLGPELEKLFGNNLSGEEISDIEAALRSVQSLDPKGVGARTLEECLLLQISPNDPDQEKLILLIKKYLKELVGNHLPSISRQTGLSIEEIQFLLKKIKKLNEDPGDLFDSRPNSVIRPDIVVEKDDAGNWQIQIDEGNAGSLYLNKKYIKELKNSAASPEDKNYIKEKINSALWVLEMIKQRKTTLHNVAYEIAEHQKDFFEKGPEAIRPLILKQIADKIKVNPSTVSRACSEKWMQTPFGNFPLKYFFTGAISAANDQEDAVAQNAALLKLKEIIDREDRSNPLSDDELVNEMQKEGIALSRRTITKYRKIMDIPNSRLRKEW